MSFVNLIVEDKESLVRYKKLLLSKELEVKEELILKHEQNKKLTEKISIIDIQNINTLKQLEKIDFKGNNKYIIIISPILNDYMKLPENIKEKKIFHLTKPINLSKFDSILKECQNQIKKDDFLKSKEKIFTHAIDDSPLGIGIYASDGSLIYSNEPYLTNNSLNKEYNLIKFDEDLNIHMSFNEIVYILKIKHILSLESPLKNKWNKSIFYFSDTKKYIVHISLDETSDKKYLEYLKKASQFFEQSTEGAIITDSNAIIVDTNQSFCAITGYSKDEVIGKKTNILNSGVHEKVFFENLWESLLIYGKWQGEIWNKRKNEEIYPEWLSITKITNDDNDEINYLAIFTDISSLKEADKKLKFYANHDNLTGFFNKAQFENMLSQNIKSAIRNNKKFALLFLDLDHFKEVNDTAGHKAGDFVLKEVALRLQNRLRKEDIIARIGGDEFNILIDNVQDESDVLILADKLNKTIKKPFLLEGKTFYLSLSIGIAIFPNHGLNSEDLSKNADSAMYEVKRSGRDGALLYNKKFTDKILKKVSLHSDLKMAIKNKQLELYYQIVYDIKSNKVTGAEALLRWNHPSRGFIPPEEFIKIAEAHNFIKDIGRFVLLKACEDLPIFLDKFGKDFILAINVSPKEFANENYTKELIEIINDFDISPNNFELEITETYIMQNHELAIKKMDELRKHGFQVAIDDFGTGYSSLSYLKKFPIDKLKIDKSFVLDFLQDKDDQDMVKAIINIAKIFHLKVQAEGVESEEHLEILKNLDCDIAQGFHYTRALPLDKILIKDWEK